MNVATARQLELIAEIRDALDGERLEWWLYGGWAMDFHVGHVTRDHSDIELFVWERNAAAVRDAVAPRGFVALTGLHPDEGQPFVKDGQEISVTYIVRDDAGRIVTPGRWRDWPWPDGSFDGARERIADIHVPVLSVAGLLDMKENFAAHPHGRPLREKDRDDITRLKALLERHA